MKFISSAQRQKNATSEKEKKVIIVITDGIKKSIKKWCNKNRSLNEFIFDICKKDASAEQNHQKIQYVKSLINKYNKRVVAILGLDRKLNTDTARHYYAIILK